MHHLFHFAFALSAFFIVFLLVLAGIFGYFLPTFLAFLTHHRRRWILAALNLFFGWSLVAWFICMVWVWAGPRKRESGNSAYFG